MNSEEKKGDVYLANTKYAINPAVSKCYP